MVKQRFFFIFILALLCVTANAQAQQFLEDASGRPFKGATYADVSGSPFMFPEWIKGTVTLNGDKTYKEVPLNIDLVAQEVFFKGKDGEKMSFSGDVVSVMFSDSRDGAIVNRILKKGFPNSSNTTSKDYFEVLADGQVSLLKRSWKIIWDEKVYNSATINRTILTKTAYYVYNKSNNSLTLFKPGKGTLLSELSNHKAEVETYIKNSKVNFSNDTDLSKLFIYYNSL